MGVTIRTDSGLKNNRMWDEWATLLDACIYDADAQQNKYDDIVKAITLPKKSKRWGEKSITMGGLGNFQAKAEGENATQDTWEQGYEKFSGISPQERRRVSQVYLSSVPGMGFISGPT